MKFNDHQNHHRADILNPLHDYWGKYNIQRLTELLENEVDDLYSESFQACLDKNEEGLPLWSPAWNFLRKRVGLETAIIFSNHPDCDLMDELAHTNSEPFEPRNVGKLIGSC